MDATPLPKLPRLVHMLEPPSRSRQPGGGQAAGSVMRERVWPESAVGVPEVWGGKVWGWSNQKSGGACGVGVQKVGVGEQGAHGEVRGCL